MAAVTGATAAAESLVAASNGGVKLLVFRTDLESEKDKRQEVHRENASSSSSEDDSSDSDDTFGGGAIALVDFISALGDRDSANVGQSV